jgi:hypothetical protein
MIVVVTYGHVPLRFVTTTIIMAMFLCDLLLHLSLWPCSFTICDYNYHYGYVHLRFVTTTIIMAMFLIVVVTNRKGT